MSECGRLSPLQSTRNADEVTCEGCRPGIAHLRSGYSYCSYAAEAPRSFLHFCESLAA